MQSYTEADAVLTGRCKARRKVANNTWLERRDDDIAVRLHDTDVVIYHPDGSITLDTGGWYTVTTKARMSEFTPFSISSTKGEWFVYVHRNWDDPVPFRDRMMWDGAKWHGIPAPDELADERAARNAMRKAIREFVKGITPERIVHAWENTGGDCWSCKFGFGGSCLADHVEEDYFHASLAYKAVQARGFRDPDVIMSMIYGGAQRGEVDRLLTDSLRKHLNRHLLEGVATR